ncbi:MAG TPA: dihydroxyacetone kinase subunit DhaK [Firmicutes bacterium]|nr:dihydroxyacetone kinase subunit DhaK [Bacillota bacterium]
MKKIINSPSTVVVEMLEGFAKAHAALVRVLPGTQVVVRADAPVKGKVGLVTGGGSGHEPAHAGYVGHGMLDAACAGNVFASPPMDQMLAAIRAVHGGAGVLCIVKNYTGDNLNFDAAMELAAAEGILCRKVVVNDDVAVKNSTWTTGRRGVAGTVFVHKLAGAKAAEGASLDEVAALAEKVIANVRTMGVALTPCVIPAVGKPNFELEEGQMEVGIGIHGEPGVERRPIAPASEITRTLLGRILPDLPFARGDEVAVMVNGMGATPLMELYILFNEVQKALAEAGIGLYRSFVGEYMTSLEMAGASVTLLKLDDELKRLLDAPARTPAFVQA